MSEILGSLEPLGHKNGRAVVLAIPDRKNGDPNPSSADRYVIVAVDVAGGEAVAARARYVNGGGWDYGHYFNGTPEQIDELIQQAVRKAIEMAGFAN